MKLTFEEIREMEILCNPSKLNPVPGQDTDTPGPSIVADSYVKLYDLDGHFSGEDPTLSDILEACESKGFKPDKSYTNMELFGRLVLSTTEHHARLFDEGLKEALADPELNEVVVNRHDVLDAKDAQRRVTTGEQ